MVRKVLLKNNKKKVNTPKSVTSSIVLSEFSKGVSLSESFEDMFPGEEPEEMRYYDIDGNEVIKNE